MDPRQPCDIGRSAPSSSSPSETPSQEPSPESLSLTRDGDENNSASNDNSFNFHLNPSVSDVVNLSSPSALLVRRYQEPPVLAEPSLSDRTSKVAPTCPDSFPIQYKHEPIHEQNSLYNTDSSHLCPPAGNVIYPLDSRVTSTHHLYVNPLPIHGDYLGEHINHRDLVGDPGVRNGTQNRPLETSRSVSDGFWSLPSTLGDGICTWEASDRDWKRNQERERNRRAHCALSENNGQDAIDEEAESEIFTQKPIKRVQRRASKNISSRKSRPKTARKRKDEQPVKRVKNKRIERPFLIGSEAWPLDETNSRKPDTPPEHTKGWRVYVRAPPGQPEITTWLKKVQFKIFHTYANPTRPIDNPPFEIEETGWGGFNVEVKLFFVNEVGARPQDRSHFLQLEPYGTEAEQEKQKKDAMVRSELLDYVEFNEPTEVMFDVLTSEDQFNKEGKGDATAGGGAGKGKGKGKAKQLKREDGEEGTVALPETSTAANPYSKELEQQLLDILKKAESQVDEQLQAEVKRGQDLEAQRKELQPAVAK